MVIKCPLIKEIFKGDHHAVAALAVRKLDPITSKSPLQGYLSTYKLVVRPVLKIKIKFQGFENKQNPGFRMLPTDIE